MGTAGVNANSTVLRARLLGASAIAGGALRSLAAVGMVTGFGAAPALAQCFSGAAGNLLTASCEHAAATGVNSTAVGLGANATGTNATAYGNGAVADGAFATATGFQANAVGTIA